MNIGERVVKSINTIVDQKIQQFDRTVQAIVRDASDPKGIGEIKVSYKDTILPAYTEVKNVKNYKQGDHVYLTIPNNDMSGRKTIVGLVDRVGPLTIINDEGDYSVTSRYQTDNQFGQITITDIWPDAADTHDDLKKYDGWCYKRNNQNQWKLYDIDYEWDENEQKKKINNNILNIENNQNLDRFFECFKNFIIQSNFVRLSANFSTKLYAEQRNLLDSNYGLKIIIKNSNGEENISFLDINTMVGNPFLQRDQKQSIRIATDTIAKEEDISEIYIQYERYDFPNAKSIYVNEEQSIIRKASVIIDYFELEAISLMPQQESADLTVYITTPKGRVFLPQGNGQINSILELKAVLKENRVQIDNSGLKCYWYEKDPTWLTIQELKDIDRSNPDYVQEKQDLIDYLYWSDEKYGRKAAVFDYGGKGWRLVTESDRQIDLSTDAYSRIVERLNEENFDKSIVIDREEILNITPYKTESSLSYFVKKEDLEGLLSKQYKLVAFYNGIQMSATIEILNSEENGAFTLNAEYDEKRAKVKYIASSNFITSKSNSKYYYEWFYAADGNNSEKIQSLSESNSVELSFNNYKYSGQIICDIYKQSENKNRKLYCSLTQSYNAPRGDNILFYGFEQVFLYNADGELSLINELKNEDENENKYTTFLREISISGPVQNIVWHIPKNSYFDVSELKTEVIDIEGSLYYTIMNRHSLNALKIIKKLTNKILRPLENIDVEYTYQDTYGNSITETRSTNFSFLKEGEDGTNGSGIVLRVLPNVDSDEETTNAVILSAQHGVRIGGDGGQIKALFNFYPRGLSNRGETYTTLNSNVSYFKVQLWKQNQKIFEGTSLSTEGRRNNISQLKWSLYNKESFLALNGVNDSKITVINNKLSELLKSSSGDEIDFTKKAKVAQGIEALLTYNQQNIVYTLPFISRYEPLPYGVGSGLKTMSIPDLKNYFISVLSKTPENDNILFSYNTIGLHQILKYYYNSDGIIDKQTYYYLKVQKKTTEERYLDLNVDGTENFEIKKTKPLHWFSFLPSEEKGKYYPGRYNNDIAFGAIELDGNIGIPIMAFLNSQEDQFFTEWEGNSVEINENNGTILAKWIAAGIKDTSNHFSGARMGDLPNKNEKKKNGLALYNAGIRSMYLNSNGTIEIGQEPSERLNLTGQGEINFGLSKRGLSLDFKQPRILYYTDELINTSEEEDDYTKKIFLFKKGNKNLFSVSENGIIRSQEIVGEKQKGINYYIFNDSKRTSLSILDNNNAYFIKETGISGFKELYLYSAGGTAQYAPVGITMNGDCITKVLTHFARSGDAAREELIDHTSSKFYGGFALTEDGLCIADRRDPEIKYSAITKGKVITNNGFFISNDIDSTNGTNAKNWRLTSKGLFSPNDNQQIMIDRFLLKGQGSQIESVPDRIYIKGSGNNAGNTPDYDNLRGLGALHVETGTPMQRGITTDGEIAARGSIRAGCDIAGHKLVTNEVEINGYSGKSIEIEVVTSWDDDGTPLETTRLVFDNGILI